MNQVKKVTVGFAQIKNEVLFDPTISMKAKGLFAYLYAKPDDWDFSGDRIASEMREGRGAVYATLKELENAGYLYRDKQKDGRVIYHLDWEKKPNDQIPQQATEPTAENRKLQKPQVAETVSISNKEKTYKQREKINTTATPSVAVKNPVNTILEAFQMKLNEMIVYGNKTQRKAVQELLDKYGEEKLLSTIDYIESVKSDPFAPVITTPYQLKEKFAQLLQYHAKKQTAKPSITFIS